MEIMTVRGVGLVWTVFHMIVKDALAVRETVVVGTTFGGVHFVPEISLEGGMALNGSSFGIEIERTRSGGSVAIGTMKRRRRFGTWFGRGTRLMGRRRRRKERRSSRIETRRRRLRWRCSTRVLRMRTRATIGFMMRERDWMMRMLRVKARMLGGRVSEGRESRVVERNGLTGWKKILRAFEGCHLGCTVMTRRSSDRGRLGMEGGVTVVNRSYHIRIRVRGTANLCVRRQRSKVVSRVELHLHGAIVTANGVIRSTRRNKQREDTR
jgi:hypothetical protein